MRRRRPRSLLSCVPLLALVTLSIQSTSASASPFDGRPQLQIRSPADGSVSNVTTPTFTGTTSLGGLEPEELSEEEWVRLLVRNSDGVLVHPEPSSTPYFFSGTWSIGPISTLAPGTYTAEVQQSDASGVGESTPVTFTIDTTPPQITLTQPHSGSTESSSSVAVGGSAGTAAGDLPAITAELFSGSPSDGQPPLETLGLQASGASWAGTFGGLVPGTYTVRATQRDSAGNTGTSEQISFSVTGVSPLSGPSSSFSWIPAVPIVGETVSLVSSATDLSSPLTGFAWALSPGAPFSAGKPVITTSFAAAGAHVVRLRVSDAAGASSVATETIPVRSRAQVPMVPFPVVRIAGRLTLTGARITLLTVQAPLAARVVVRCRGRGCPTKSESRSAKSSRKGTQKAGSVLLTFRRFARSYGAGATLEILVVKPGEIGKYTRFKIRRNRLPVREDRCIVSGGAKPITCAQQK